MARIPIITAPDPILKLKSHEMLQNEINDQMKILIKDMIDAMYTDRASGFAAVQFGVHKRLIVLDLGDDDETPREPDFYPKVLINPEFTYQSEELVMASEGCISVPEIRLDVARSVEVEIKYKDIDFKDHVIRTGGWLARVIQHEMDHLDGITLLDRMSVFKRDVALRKLKKLKKSL